MPQTMIEAEARIKSRVWQEIAQSGLDTSSLDKETLNSLVELVTDAALLEVDDMLNESLDEEEAALDDLGDERVLWQGRPFLSAVAYYTITNERVKIRSGLLGKTYEYIDLIRIQDLKHSQSFGERLLKIGDVTIYSHDATQPEYILRNVKNPDNVYEILHRAIKQTRKEKGLGYQEEM
ncbi:MAG TPA: PH domain-containing protein [Anaerolineae bacterium]|nr:PH domain-containing protein [Anaerolineae bacterium]